MGIPRKKNSRTGVLCYNKYPKKSHKHHGIHSYCVLCNKAGIPEHKYMLHSAKDFTGMCTNRTIKDVMGGSVESSTGNTKQYKKTENKWGSI